MNLKQVSKEEFDIFVKQYPNKLTTGCSTICEPPIRHYFDESLKSQYELGTADYFYDKVVAQVSLGWLGPNNDVDNSGKYFTYYIKE